LQLEQALIGGGAANSAGNLQQDISSSALAACSKASSLSKEKEKRCPWCDEQHIIHGWGNADDSKQTMKLSYT
jgi:hypothetical protein